MLFRVGDSWHILYYILIYLYVSYSGSITSLWEENAILLLSFTCNYVVSVRRGFSLPLGVWNGLHYFIVALPNYLLNIQCQKVIKQTVR